MLLLLEAREYFFGENREWTLIHANFVGGGFVLTADFADFTDDDRGL
jgi:hypothetical protein